VLKEIGSKWSKVFPKTFPVEKRNDDLVTRIAFSSMASIGPKLSATWMCC
jgi:hypothetical protein